jgi:hypothetical protein
MSVELKQIMGPGSGISGLEECPEVFHFELTEEQLFELIIDQQQQAQSIGLTSNVTNVTVLEDKGAKSPGGKPIYCCIDYHGHILCRRWG